MLEWCDLAARYMANLNRISNLTQAPTTPNPVPFSAGQYHLPLWFPLHLSSSGLALTVWMCLLVGFICCVLFVKISCGIHSGATPTTGEPVTAGQSNTSQPSEQNWSNGEALAFFSRSIASIAFSLVNKFALTVSDAARPAASVTQPTN